MRVVIVEGNVKIKYVVTVKKWFSVSGLTEVIAGFQTKKDAVEWVRSTEGPKWKIQHEVLKVVATKLAVELDATGGESSTSMPSAAPTTPGG